MFLDKIFKKKKQNIFPKKLQNKIVSILKEKKKCKSKSEERNYLENAEEIFSEIRLAFDKNKNSLTNSVINKIVLGEFDKAENILNKSIEENEKKTNIKLYDFYRLALLKKLALEYKQSEEYYTKALKIESSDTLILKSYANLLLSYKKPKTALKFLLKALKEEKIRFGNKSPIIAESYSKIAYAYTLLEQKEKIFFYLKEALIINENTFGEFHIKTGDSLKAIAMFFAKSEEGKKNAIKYFEQALSIYEKAYGEKNLETAYLMLHFANLLYNLEEKKSALKYFEKSEKVFTTFFGPDDPTTKYAVFKKELIDMKK